MRTTTIGRLGVEPQLREDRGVGLEVREVVLLLEPLVRAHLSASAITLQPLRRDRVGHHHRARQAAVDLVLHGGPLVVEHRRARDPQQRGGDAHVVGAVAERDVEAPSGRAPLPERPTRERGRTQRKARALRREPLAAVAADRGVGDLETAQQAERLGEVARRHPHFVAIALQRLDHRTHHQHVRTVGEVDPDAHDREDGIVGAPMLVLASVTESVVTATWHFVRDGGLPAVFLLMALGSACIPIPSEVVMLFAGFAVADPGGSGAHHHLTMTGIVLAGLLGTLVGSWVAYGIGRGGRLELMERHGHLVHMAAPPRSSARTAGSRATERSRVLFGRMIPLVRAFVSLPAGVAKMPPLRFTVLTLIGSIPWVLALALAGHGLGSEWTNVRKGFEYVDYAILALVVAGIGYVIVRRRLAARAAGCPRGGDRRIGTRGRRLTHPAVLRRRRHAVEALPAPRDRPRPGAGPHRGASGLLLGAPRAAPSPGGLAGGGARRRAAQLPGGGAARGHRGCAADRSARRAGTGGPPEVGGEPDGALGLRRQVEGRAACCEGRAAC